MAFIQTLPRRKPRSGGAFFDPRIHLAIDSQSGTDMAVLSLIVDDSVYGNNAIEGFTGVGQLGGAIYNENVINSLPVLTFAGNSGYYITSADNNKATTQSSGFFVINHDTGGEGVFITKGNNTTSILNSMWFKVNTDDTIDFIFLSSNTINTRYSTDKTMVDGQFYVISFTHNSTTIDIKINGISTAITVTDSSGGFNGDVSNNSAFIIGADGGAGNADRPMDEGYDGEIAEIMFWVKELSTEEEASILSYLLTKYNITPVDLT